MGRGEKNPLPGTPSEREAALADALADGVDSPKDIVVSSYLLYTRIKSGVYGKGDYVKNHPFEPLDEAQKKLPGMVSKRLKELTRHLLKKNIIATRKGVTSRRVTDLLDSPVANMAPLTPAAGEL